jgi:hypothetical protein
MGRQLHDCTDCYGTHSRDNVTKPHQLDYKLTLAGPLASVRRPKSIEAWRNASNDSRKIVLVFCVNLDKKIHLPLSNTKQAAMDISGFLVDFP